MVDNDWYNDTHGSNDKEDVHVPGDDESNSDKEVIDHVTLSIYVKLRSDFLVSEVAVMNCHNTVQWMSWSRDFEYIMSSSLVILLYMKRQWSLSKI